LSSNKKFNGHGTKKVKIKKGAAYILTINNLEGLIALCRLINGKMRGPKYHQFVLLLSYLNNKYPIWPEPLRRMAEINLKPLGFLAHL
jgi:hypothetical protein